MRGIYSLVLLTIANVFMTLAWYGHLRFRKLPFLQHTGLLGIILLSWGIALLEYCFQVPANRIGFKETGGPFTLWQLKVAQEVITLVVFTAFSLIFFRNEPLRWNHLAAGVCLVLAVYFIFKK